MATRTYDPITQECGCYAVLPERRITFCPLHREAEEMHDYIRTFAPLGGCVYKSPAAGIKPTDRPCRCGYCWARDLLRRVE